MTHNYWSDWYFGWGWFLWLGFVMLLFSSLGNWGYTYRAHRKFSGQPRLEAYDILDQRYARGEITSVEYSQIKTDLNRA